MLCLVLIQLSALEWLFGFHNVTLEAVKVNVLSKLQYFKYNTLQLRLPNVEG